MPEYRLRVQGMEIVVDSKEALYELMADFGSHAPTVADQSASPTTPMTNARPSGTNMDKVMLRNFVEAGRRGMPSDQLQMSLGANRKTVQDALMKWAERIGLRHGSFEAIFERNIQEGKRGYRLTNAALFAAKDILGLN